MQKRERKLGYEEEGFAHDKHRRGEEAKSRRKQEKSNFKIPNSEIVPL